MEGNVVNVNECEKCEKCENCDGKQVEIVLVCQKVAKRKSKNKY